MLKAGPVLLPHDEAWSVTMARTFLAVVVALAPLALAQSQALGVEAPWCAVTKDGDHWDCRYWSAAECQPNVVTGNRGWCNQNPYFVAVATKRRPAR
jgi:hypothetical protein